MYHMKHTPARKLADALFRGSRREHSFKVYPLGANITDQPAVFIISRRIVDRFGRGHQATVCIGETESTYTELEKHKKAACVKEHAANVVCLLKEKDHALRLKAIEDLLSRRSFSCVRNVYKSNIKPTSKQKDRASRNAKTTSRASISKSRTARAQRTGSAKTRTRVSRGVDSDRRQHRLSKQERPAAGKAKGRVTRGARSRKKAA